MLSALFGRNRRNPQHAAEELMTLLDENASLVVDEQLVAAMGVGRKTLYRIIYEMVRRERMFMLADKSDRMLLMTNTEFNRFLFQRSGRAAPLPALTMEGMKTVRVEAMAEESQSEQSDIILCAEEDSDLIIDFDWLNAEALIKETVATEVPERRQGLPERKREPWPVLEDFEKKSNFAEFADNSRR